MSGGRGESAAPCRPREATVRAAIYIPLVIQQRHVTDDSVAADLEVVQSRFDALEVLASERVHKPRLQERLEVSRSTIDRAIRDLESAGFVRREDDGYRLTLYGDLFRECYASFLETAGNVSEAGPLLETLPPDAPVSTALLDDATIHRSSAPATHRPVSHFEDLLRDASRLRGVSRTISQPTTARRLHDRIVEGEMEAELVVSDELASYMHDQRYDVEREMIVTDRYRLLAVESAPFGLALVDRNDGTTVVTFVYGDSDDLLGTIVNDTSAAVEWAEDVFQRYRSRAEDISDQFR